MTDEDLTRFLYVSRGDIFLSEETEVIQSADAETTVLSKVWNANFRGRPKVWEHDLTGSFQVRGPEVEMSRSGKTAQEAYRALVDALAEQGWEVSY